MRRVLALICLALGCSPSSEGGESILRFASIEGRLESDRLVVSVERAGSTAGAVAVRFAVQDGSAVAGADYVASEGVLEWADGEGGTRQIEILLVDDAVYEETETIMLELFEPSGARLDPSSAAAIEKQQRLRTPDEDALGPVKMGAILRIFDDDPAPLASVFEIRGLNVVTSPNQASIEVMVARTASARGEVAVDYETREEDAVPGVDFVPMSGTLRWSDADSGGAMVSIAVPPDATAGRTFRFMLLNPAGNAVLGALSSIRIAVPDLTGNTDNLPPVADPGQPIIARDDDGDGVETVQLDGSASNDPDGTIVAYAWYLEDALIAAEATASIALTVGEHALLLRVTDDRGAVASASVMVTVEGVPQVNAPLPLRINAGGAAAVDAAGNAWSGDAPYGPGAAWGYENPSSGPAGTVDRQATNPAIDIGGTEDEALFATERWGLAAYRAHVPNGTYRITLLFAESWSAVTGPGQRVFGVAIEGVLVAPAIDVYAAVGFMQAYSIVADGVSVQDGRLDIDFLRNLQNPMINGIEIAESVPDQTQTVEVRISNGGDDAEENVATGAVNLGSTDLELAVTPTNEQIVGLRFRQLSIPPGAVITRAYLQFQVDEVSTAEASLWIAAESANHASMLNTTAFDLSSRARSATSVRWEPAPWPTIDEAGADQQTPDLSAVLQEIIDRPGWAERNAVLLLIGGTGTRTARSYNGLAAGAPLLHVEYR